MLKTGGPDVMVEKFQGVESRQPRMAKLDRGDSWGAGPSKSTRLPDNLKKGAKKQGENQFAEAP